MRQKTNVVATKKRVGYDGVHAVVVPDEAAGHRDRYTVYLVPSHPCYRRFEAMEIIGRELTWAHACRLVETRSWET